MEYAQEELEYKTIEYEKISDNFQALAEGACNIIQFTENIKIFPSDKNLKSEESISNIEAETGEIIGEDKDNALGREDAPKESWMLDFRHTSSQDSLSEEVRKAIRQVPMVIDGEVQIDDLGYVRFLDPTYVHATLISELRHMTKPEHMYMLLDKLAEQKPWVVELINTLKEDEVLESKFYQNYRKDFMPYWIMSKKVLPTGDFKFETISINQPEGIYYLIDSWRDNYESNNILSEFSVYNNKGEIDLKNAERGYDLIQDLQDEYFGLDQEELLEYLTPERLKVLKDLMGGLGITVNDNIFKNTLVSYPGTFDVGSDLNIFNLLEKLNVIYKNISEGAVKKSYREDGSEFTEDLINTFDSAYTAIATMFAEVSTDAIESSIRENGKSYYSHVKSSYLNKMIKNLKGKLSDPQEFSNFIEEEFGQYEFFKKDGEWMNSWLELLTNESTSKDARELLEHKMLLNFDKQDYSKWDGLDYHLVLLNEFFSMPDDFKGALDYAWYYVPILSDAPSAEFIKFVRYKDRYEPYIVNGLETDYKGKITHELTKLVMQEYSRIMLVRDRAERISQGADIKPIANYDMVLDNEGNIIKIGGAEFKFLPILNKVNFNGELVKEGEKTFLDEMVEKSQNPDNHVLLLEEVTEALGRILEVEFEKEYRKFHDIGVLDTSEDSPRYKYLEFRNQNKYNENMSKRMLKAKQLLGSDLWTRDHQNLLEAYKNNEVLFSDNFIERILDDTKSKLEELADNNPDLFDEISILNQNLELDNFAKDKLREYFYNNKLAQSQIIQLTTTDLAFYKNMEDFQKRFKQVHAPANRLNTFATYKGVRYGKEKERVAYLKDEYTISSSYDDIVAAIKENEHLSESDKLSIISKFASNNVTDAQAYRSLNSYRDLLVMLGEMNDETFQAIENFKKGVWDAEDFNVLWQTKKPFVYTQVTKDSGTGVNMKVPLQHKNSEFLLMVGHSIVAGNEFSKNLTMGKSGKLRALNNWMLANDIDVVQFESAVKVGNQGIIDLNTKEPKSETKIKIGDNSISFSSTRELNKKLAKLIADGKINNKQANEALKDYQLREEKETAQALYEATGLGDGNFITDVDPEGGIQDVVHSLNYEDYGIQTETPEHILDTDLALGTQIRKLIMADISDSAVLELNGKDIKPVIEDGKVVKTAKEVWKDYYNEIITENIIKSFEQLDKDFNSPEKIEKLILEEVKNNDRYSKDLILACQLQEEQIVNENGQVETVKRFNLPLFDPVQSIRIQNLLNSIIKSRITKQKIKGGSLIQVTNYGLNDDLKIVFEKDSKGKLRIKHIECMMPWYTREFLDPLMDEGTHELDISRIPEDLREAIGYRVPTEDKYSMIPLYIKGFTPRQNGSVIMLPSDITTLSGADFDVDKLYVLLPEFRTYSTFNIRKSWNKFYQENPNIVREIEDAKLDAFDEFLDRSKDELGIDPEQLSDEEYFDIFDKYIEKNKKEGVRNYDYLEGVKEDFAEWLKQKGNKVDYKKHIEKIQYDYNKPAKDQSLAARNNAIIDLMRSVLTSSDTVDKILRGGNFDAQKKASRIVTFIENINYEDLEKLGNINDIIESIQKMDISELDDLLERYQEDLDPLAPSTQVYFHQQNMTGLALIGVYANHNANHALTQYTNLQLVDGVTLNKKTYTKLNAIKNKEGQFITSIIAGYLAASVDNAKDPVLLALNQNQFTADTAMLLTRLGFNPLEVGLFLTQPAIKNITQRYFREQRFGMSADAIIDDEISKLAKKAGLSSSFNPSKINTDILTNKRFILNKINNKRIQAGEKLSNNTLKDYHYSQLAIAVYFKDVLNKSSALGDLVLAIRADTTKGGAGPSIADTIIKLQRLDDIYEAGSTIGYPLLGWDFIDRYMNFENIDDLRNQLLKKELPFLQAFQTLGLQKTQDILQKYFPFYNKNFQSILKRVKDFTKNDKLDVKTINSVFQDFMAFYLTSTEFFGDEYNSEGDLVVSKEQKRAAFLNDFPQEFVRIKKEHPDLENIPFLKQLKYIKPGKNNPIPLIVFKEVGRLSPNRRDQMMRDWQSLMYYPDPVGPQLALNLLRYSFFRNGLGFGPNTFSHLAPTLLRMAIPEYRDTLFKMVNDPKTYNNFADQFVRNHLDNRRLVHEVDLSKFDKIVDKDNIEVGFTINLGNYRSAPVKELTKSYIKKGGNIIGVNSLEYITFKHKGKNYYYQKLTPNGTLEAIYAHINPLNYKNNSLEYDIDVDADTMESQVRPIEINADSGYRSYDFSTQGVEESFHRPYYNSADLQASSYEDLTSIQEADIETNSDFDIVFGDPNLSENLDNVPPVKDFRDADNLPNC